jgi:hypothetical protein
MKDEGNVPNACGISERIAIVGPAVGNLKAMTSNKNPVVTENRLAAAANRKKCAVAPSAASAP